MKTRRSRYHGYRFPAEIISHAVWLYHRFCLSFRDVEDLLAERCIIVSYETIRHWCQKCGPDYARKLKRRQGRLGDTWHLDELFLKINGELQYLWRAVDQDGDGIDILFRAVRNTYSRTLIAFVVGAACCGSKVGGVPLSPPAYMEKQAGSAPVFPFHNYAGLPQG